MEGSALSQCLLLFLFLQYRPMLVKIIYVRVCKGLNLSYSVGMHFIHSCIHVPCFDPTRKYATFRRERVALTFDPRLCMTLASTPSYPHATDNNSIFQWRCSHIFFIVFLCLLLPLCVDPHQPCAPPLHFRTDLVGPSHG